MDTNITPYQALNGSMCHIPVGKKVIHTEDKAQNKKAQEIIFYILNHITQMYNLESDWILEENISLDTSSEKSRDRVSFLRVFLQITQDILRRDRAVAFREIMDYHWETWLWLIPAMEKAEQDLVTKSVLSATINSLVCALTKPGNHLKYSRKTNVIQYLKTMHQIYFPDDYPSTVDQGPLSGTVGNPGNFLKNLSSG